MISWAILLNKLIEIVEKLLYVKRQKDRQTKVDQAAHDPGRAFAERFDGVVHNLPEDARETDHPKD